MKAHSLMELKALQQQLAAQAAQRAAQEQALRLRQAQARAERELFSLTVGAVQPLPPSGLAELPRTPVAPVPVQRDKDSAAALRESLSDEFDAHSLLDTDDALSFRRPGIGTDVTRKLRRGDWSIQAQVDLHGLRRDQAREALGGFIRESVKTGLRCVRVVHGKGLGSPGKTPVLKSKVLSWLMQKSEVIAFVQARPAHGGAGALLVLLRPKTP